MENSFLKPFKLPNTDVQSVMSCQLRINYLHLLSELTFILDLVSPSMRFILSDHLRLPTIKAPYLLQTEKYPFRILDLSLIPTTHLHHQLARDFIARILLQFY